MHTLWVPPGCQILRHDVMPTYAADLQATILHGFHVSVLATDQRDMVTRQSEVAAE